MTYRPFFRHLAQDAVLDAIIARSFSGAVVVLDLDGCLFDTRPRQVTIFAEWGARVGHAAYARVLPEHFLDRSHQGTLLRAGVPADIVARDLPALERFWLDHFFDDAHLMCDVPLPGAAPLVRALHGRGVQLVYLTARHDDMRPGTLSALERFGFPWGDDRCALLTKTDPAERDDHYKARQLAHISSLGPVVAAFDNEPANVNLFADAWPEATVVRVHTDHSSTDPLRPGVVEVAGFLRTTDP